MAFIDAATLTRTAERALLAYGAHAEAAASTARALVMADRQGLASHGVSRIPQYVSHLQLVSRHV
ncbi:Ldh family oxidoreductase [Paludibacterium sp.]|uniref:Ldh family oxidoreductase n=1 Tax=Paludibacterium sp. TaxID=1917523 RepID=UPI0025D1FD18|nr:Ldh family oxidoreductase [Paludibacterium sp.]MBV8648476.1 Ldh family oxidoreductase [Paludibacterium sp.]